MYKYTIGIKVFQTIESVSLSWTSFRTVNERSTSPKYCVPSHGLQVSPDYMDPSRGEWFLFTQFLCIRCGFTIVWQGSRNKRTEMQFCNGKLVLNCKEEKKKGIIILLLFCTLYCYVTNEIERIKWKGKFMLHILYNKKYRFVLKSRDKLKL